MLISTWRQFSHQNLAELKLNIYWVSQLCLLTVLGSKKYLWGMHTFYSKLVVEKQKWWNGREITCRLRWTRERHCLVVSCLKLSRSFQPSLRRSNGRWSQNIILLVRLFLQKRCHEISFQILISFLFSPFHHAIATINWPKHLGPSSPLPLSYEFVGIHSIEWVDRVFHNEKVKVKDLKWYCVDGDSDFPTF